MTAARWSALSVVSEAITPETKQRQMTTQKAKQAGAEHAKNGKLLTPFDCREIDAVILSFCRGSASPAKEYAKLRGAFNKAWQIAYFNGTQEVAS